jgi:hypothetical protein
MSKLQISHYRNVSTDPPENLSRIPWGSVEHTLGTTGLGDIMYSLNNHSTYAYVYVRACVRTYPRIVADSKINGDSQENNTGNARYFEEVGGGINTFECSVQQTFQLCNTNQRNAQFS